MGVLIDLSGKQFGRLKVLKRVFPNAKHGHSRWECLCDCGKTTVTHGHMLKGKHTKSCGCLRAESPGGDRYMAYRQRKLLQLPEPVKTIDTIEYLIWREIKGRCMDSTHCRFRLFGGLGIEMHPAWIRSYVSFLSSMGLRPSPRHRLRRIDEGGHFTPENCIWTIPVGIISGEIELSDWG